MSEIVIDRKTYKIMRYIYLHNGASLAKIGKKFKKDGVTTATYLCPAQYAMYSEQEGKYTFDISSTSYDGMVYLTAKGNQYVENRISCFAQWIVSTLISFIALIISFIALFTAGNNEIIVHLIK